ncbi:MAG: pyridoxamine 5'-phosphate oxidase family protein [Fulvivirga sp.]|nr:pyridoxamine 5'-phosphate oxidase family protein [Fulvivirga sp.]
MSKYEISSKNKVKRVPERGHYDKKTIYSILDDAYVCHVGFVIEGQPFVIPTLYGRKDNLLYLHGASSSRMIKQIEKSVPVCVTVTHIDGLVLARSAFHHSMNYRSVIVFGNAIKISEGQKEKALEIISEHIIPGRWKEVRPPSAKELKATTVLTIDIDQASAKIRQGPPGDNKEDYELNIWAGVIPLSVQRGAPVADEALTRNIPLSKAARAYSDKN